MKSVIFDLDGTLIDSMGVWEKIDFELLKKYGHVPDFEYLNKIHTLTFNEGVNYIIKKYGINKTKEELIEEINTMALEEYANNLFLKDGVFDFLKEIRESGYKCAIATSSMREMCEAVLKNNRVISFFDDIKYSDEIGKGKNHPDIYIEAAEGIGAEIKNSFIFEDAPYAINGAIASGATVIGVFDKYFKDSWAIMNKKCHGCIKSFIKFNIDEMERVYRLNK